MISDRDRFHARTGSEWQASRPITYFWEMLDGVWQREGIKGLRAEVVNYFRCMGGDLSRHLEFVNALTHLSDSVLEARRRALVAKGYDEPSAARKAEEWPLYRSVRRLWEESHWFWRNRNDKRRWHARLQKLEALI